MTRRLLITFGIVGGVLGIFALWFGITLFRAPAIFFLAPKLSLPQFSSVVAGEIVSVNPEARVFRVKVSFGNLLFPELVAASSDGSVFYNVHVDGNTAFRRSTFLLSDHTISGQKKDGGSFEELVDARGLMVLVLGNFKRRNNYAYTAEVVNFITPAPVWQEGQGGSSPSK